MNESLAELLADYQSGPSEWKIDHFIIAEAGPTLYAQYMQALRELQARVATLQAMYLDREEQAEALEILSGERGTVAERRQCLRVANLGREIAEVERQVLHFYVRATNLKIDLGDLTPERRNAMERETWRARLRIMVRLDACNGGLQPRTAELVLNTPLDWRDELVRLAQDREGALEWFKTHKPVSWTYRTTVLGPPPDIRQLICEGAPQLE